MLLGLVWEARIRDKAASYLGDIAEQVRVLSPEALDRELDPAVAAGAIARKDAVQVRRTDFVCSARDPKSNERLFVAVEVSARVALRDVERAAARAKILAAIRTAIPVVAGQRIDRDAEAAAAREGVRLVIATEE